MPIRKGTSHQYKSQQKQFVWQKQCSPVNFSFFFYIICIYQYFINRIRRGVVIMNLGYLMKSLGHLGNQAVLYQIFTYNRLMWVLLQHMNITLRMVKYFYISYYKLTSPSPKYFFPLFHSCPTLVSHLNITHLVTHVQMVYFWMTEIILKWMLIWTIQARLSLHIIILTFLLPKVITYANI